MLFYSCFCMYFCFLSLFRSEIFGILPGLRPFQSEIFGILPDCVRFSLKFSESCRIVNISV
jgi:hypothetical protein